MVARTGRPVFVPQVPQRDVRSSVQAEQHEHLVNGACFSLICVPVGIGDHTEGAFLLARDQPGAPYEHDDVAFAEALASRVARARLVARRYQAAWSAREHVVDVVTAAAVEHERAEDLSRPALHELLDWACAGDPEAVVAFLDLDLCHLVCSKAYAMVFGQVPTLLTAMPLAAFVDDNETIPFKFEKVLSGELDYRTIEVRPLAVPSPMMLHCAMIRRPDATPWCIAVVGHLVPRAACSERVTTAVR
jgi:hypothetical protein